MSKKKSELTPDEIIIKSTERIQDLEGQKRPVFIPDKNGKPQYSYKNANKNKKIENKIELEELKIDLAEQNKEAEKVKKPPHTVVNDNSKVFAPQVNIKANSDNKKGVNDAFNGSIGNKEAAPKNSVNKKSKVKMIFFGIIAVIVLAGVIALTVRITNCVNDIKNNSSSIYSAISI